MAVCASIPCFRVQSRLTIIEDIQTCTKSSPNMCIKSEQGPCKALLRLIQFCLFSTDIRSAFQTAADNIRPVAAKIMKTAADPSCGQSPHKVSQAATTEVQQLKPVHRSAHADTCNIPGNLHLPTLQNLSAQKSTSTVKCSSDTFFEKET